MYAFLLQHNVSYYVNKDTPMFSTSLGVSKAFDRTNHNLLFTKLINCGVPMCIRLMVSWNMATQMMRSICLSDAFTRQGVH